ncbi:MAG: MFS transporter [Roseibacillus sp.]
MAELESPTPSSLIESEWNRRTFRLELLRSVPAGVIETVGTTFAVFLAVSVFSASQMEKAVLVASASVGLLLSLFMVQFVRRIGCSINIAISAIAVFAAAGFFVAAFNPGSLLLYLFGLSAAQLGLTLSLPLYSQIYRRHYPDVNRGRLFAVTAIVRKVAAIVAALSFGFWLRENPVGFPALLKVYAVCCLLMAFCVQAMTPIHLRKTAGVRLFDAFEHVKRDRQFRLILIAWMVLGFGNLICFGIFVEFVANPAYGYGLGADQVSLITTTTPEACFLITVFLWGLIFDRVNFFVTRIVINLFFIAAVLVFFLGGEVWTLYVGLALHGIGKAGGNVAWSLWVTKFAKAEHVAEYMSVHTFLTGCRGTAAPFLGFAVAAALSPQVVGVVGAILMTIATLMIVPLLQESRRG